MTKRLLPPILLLLLIVSCSQKRQPHSSTPGSSITPAKVSTVGKPTPTITSTPSPRGAPAESGAYAPNTYRLQPGELILAAEEDAIPAVFADDTLFVDAEAGNNEWQDDDLVIGVLIEEDARAYPVRLLSSHEIVNDIVGGQPIVVTWCPLCYSAIVFDRVVERELTFGVSGYLFRNNLVMYDHQTNTLWSQILAQGIRGALNGQQLQLIPSLLTEWGQWKKEYPETRVLSAKRLGKQAKSIVDPYAGYYASGISGLTGNFEDDRLPPKELVVGLVTGNEARAYPLSALQEQVVVNDRLASLPLLLLYDTQLQTVWVYRRQAAERTLTFRQGDEVGTVRDENTGSLWDVRTGAVLEGPLQGARLQRLSAPLVYWFAWSAIYPETDLRLFDAETQP